MEKEKKQEMRAWIKDDQVLPQNNSTKKFQDIKIKGFADTF